MSLRIVLLGVILMTAIGLGLIGLQMSHPAASPVAVAAPVKVHVLTAARVVAGGTLLKDEDIASSEILESQTPADALRDTPETRSNLHGALVLHYLDKGARLTAADILRPRDRGFLAAVLAAGTRAISVGVDSVTGTAGLIWPGDRVDLILTQQLDASQAAANHRVVGETILSDVRVIAVDQKMVQGADEAGSTIGNVARTVTLEVTPEQAERVAVAERLGQLSVTVRSMADAGNGHKPKSGAVYASDVSTAVQAAPATTDFKMLVIQGTEHQEMKFQ